MRPIRIMVVYDHQVVREGLHGMLDEEDDLEVVGDAKNGQEAVEKAGDLRPDVIVMDLQMPELDGGAAMRQIRADNPEVKFVVMTTYSTDEHVLMGVEAGADAFLLKDAVSEELFEAIRTVHSGGSYFQPAVATRIAQRFVELSQQSRRSRDPRALTERELGVLDLVARGTSNKRIAAQLSITERTAKAHVTSILQKLGASDRAEAVAVALQRGFLKGDPTA
jgi:DNA-binding NarL/FixJ family response regulator